MCFSMCSIIAMGIELFDAGEVIAASPIDGVHFEKEAHQTLGTVLGFIPMEQLVTLRLSSC